MAVPASKAGSVKAIRVRITAYVAGTGAQTFVLRVNAADTAITGTVTATGWFQATGSVSIAQGDSITVVYRIAAGSGASCTLAGGAVDIEWT